MHWFGWVLLVFALGLAVWLSVGLVKDSIDLRKRRLLKQQSTEQNSAEIKDKEQNNERNCNP